MVQITGGVKIFKFTMSGFDGEYKYVVDAATGNEYIQHRPSNSNKTVMIFAISPTRGKWTAEGEQAYNAIKFYLEGKK